MLPLCHPGWSGFVVWGPPEGLWFRFGLNPPPGGISVGWRTADLRSDETGDVPARRGCASALRVSHPRAVRLGKVSFRGERPGVWLRKERVSFLLHIDLLEPVPRMTTRS